ncbi:MAG: hypothetical protein QGF00_32615 [Planctomycetota bacterium]|jgi:hypothetical protein|nr:hypothetical protein [Planctomycetota bacterium]MDP7254386.1 hypothetical protein [Planctomycetota bacterium]
MTRTSDTGEAAETTSGPTRRRILSGSYIIIIAIFCFLRVKNFAAIEQAMVTSDTKAFMGIAAMPLLDPGFWSAERAATVPFLYKILYQRQDAICLFQFGLSVLSCIALGRMAGLWNGGTSSIPGAACVTAPAHQTEHNTPI